MSTFSSLSVPEKGLGLSIRVVKNLLLRIFLSRFLIFDYVCKYSFRCKVSNMVDLWEQDYWQQG